MDQSGLWTRMGQWLRRGPLGVAAGKLPRVGRDGLLSGVPVHGSARDAEARDAEAADSAPRRLSKQEVREQALARLEDGHQRLVGLMESIRDHLDAQDRQGKAMVESLVDIGGHLSRMTQSVGKQSETLGAVAAHMQAAGERARRVEEALACWPALAESQRTTLVLLADQVSSERVAVERIGESLGVYGGALASLDRSTASASESLKGLHRASSRHEEQLEAIGRRQGKWLVLLFAAAAAVAVLAAALVIIALIR